jgi:hypothetical protein
MPNPGKIMHIADDGRQREAKWEMSVNLLRGKLRNMSGRSDEV